MVRETMATAVVLEGSVIHATKMKPMCEETLKRGATSMHIRIHSVLRTAMIFLVYDLVLAGLLLVSYLAYPRPHHGLAHQK